MSGVIDQNWGEQNSLGNNNLNFRLARDQAVHLETAAIFRVAAGVKQMLFSQFVSFLRGKNNSNTEGLRETNLLPEIGESREFAITL